MPSLSDELRKITCQEEDIAKFASEFDIDLTLEDPELTKQLIGFFKQYLQESSQTRPQSQIIEEIPANQESSPKPKESENKGIEDSQTSKTYQKAVENSLRTHTVERTKSILDMLLGFYQKEANFKTLCNKIYRGVKSFVDDPNNPIYKSIPIFYEDLENNDDCLVQLVCLCDDYSLSVDSKPKGVFVLFQRNDLSYIQILKDFLQALRYHKDETIKAGKIQETKTKLIPVDPNGQERIAAFLEARQRRAIVASIPQEPLFFDHQTPAPSASLPPNNSQPSNPSKPQAYCLPSTDYPPLPQSTAPTSSQSYQSSPNPPPNPSKSPYSLCIGSYNPPPSSGFSLSNNSQLQAHRQAMKQKYLANRPTQTVTFSDLSLKTDSEDRILLGKECLRLTNKFRKEQGLSELKWEPQMESIGRIW